MTTHDFLPKDHDWIESNNTLSRTYTVDNPTKFITDVHAVGNIFGHSPKDIRLINPSTVEVVLQTDTTQGVTTRDFSLAYSLDLIAENYQDLQEFEGETRRAVLANFLAESGLPNKYAFLTKQQKITIATFEQQLLSKGYTLEASLIKEAQLAEPETELLGSPQVRVAPALGGEIQEAINRIKKEVDPNYFENISKIDVLMGGPFGQVSSDDPAVVKINLNKIKQEVKRQLDQRFNQENVQFEQTNPEHLAIFDEVLTRALIEVVSHEKGHVDDFRPKIGPHGDFLGGDFPGGEAVADAEANRVKQQTVQNHPLPFE